MKMSKRTAFDTSLANLQQKGNVLIPSEGIVPNDELVHRPTLSKRISKEKVEELTVQRYRICGKGIPFFPTKSIDLTDISTTIRQNVPLHFHRMYHLAK
jgi:hypothetical protein